jgi:mannitol-1-/sugar-/sorbitol-6-phosphatase
LPAARHASWSDSAPPLLFDLDGTLVDSRRVVERHWAQFCARHGLDLAAVLAVVHGIRSSDAIRRIAPELDAEAEARLLDAAEEVDTDGLEVVPGAAEVLASLAPGRWGIVTSGHRSLARRRLEAVGLPVPAALVCGDEITRGKPDPEGYLAGAHALGVAPEACVAVEDAPAGVLAAQAAGMPVIAVTTTHSQAALAGASARVVDLRGLGAALAEVRAALPGYEGGRRQ